jgi:hypothetical protein
MVFIHGGGYCIDSAVKYGNIRPPKLKLFSRLKIRDKNGKKLRGELNQELLKMEGEGETELHFSSPWKIRKPNSGFSCQYSENSNPFLDE